MKQRVLSCLMALCLLLTAVAPGLVVWAEENNALEFPEIELELSTKPEEPRSDEEDELGQINSGNAAAMESLGKTDWQARADKVVRTGDWREDLVHLAESQVGYQEDSHGHTIYGGDDEEDAQPADWTSLFINWLADQADLTSRQFPRGESYKDLRKKMDRAGALKKISRANYPVSGDIAFIENGDQKLVAVIVYVANGYATVIHGDDQGRVTRVTYQVDTSAFRYYADMNVLMEHAGIETGKGGKVPQIPEGGVAAWTNTKAVYLRKEPTTASKSLTTVKKAGTAVLVTSAALQEDGYIWYGVSYKNYEGYIRGDLLRLDMAAIPTGPAATTPPAATPAPEVIPGCSICVAAAGGVALPVDCCYAHLAAMDRGEQVRFMASLRMEDPATFQLYVACHAAHTAGGEAGLVCLGDACGESAWMVPGAAHAENCPWHLVGGLAQERVVNVEIREGLAGQQITILYEIAGATAYQWHEVRSVLNADGSVTETDSVLEGQTAHFLTVTARDEQDVSYSYYCVATIEADGALLQVTGKTTVITLADAPVVASAVLGEEINFTYVNESAAAYQWYVQKDANAVPVAITADHAAYTGAAGEVLTFHATAENSGALYSCTALDAAGAVVGTSGYYAYAIPAEMYLEKDVLGFGTKLEVRDSSGFEPAGCTFQWYQLVLTEDGEQYVVLEGQTASVLDVCYPFQKERYYCIYKDVDGNEKMSAVFVVEAQTTNWDDYLNVLYGDYDEIVYQNEQPITDYAVVACQWMDKWDVTLEDGSNLAQNVLNYWYEYPDELLCSCVISGAVTVDGIILDAHDQHDASCPWHVSSPTLSLTENTAPDGSVYYTLSMVADGETTILATTEMLDGVHHYFKDTKTGIFVAWLRIDADGSMWIVPLESEN